MIKKLISKTLAFIVLGFIIMYISKSLNINIFKDLDIMGLNTAVLISLAISLAVAPLLAIGIYFGGKAVKGVFCFLFILSISGAAFVLIPFFDLLIGETLTKVVIVLLPTLGLAAFWVYKRLLKHEHIKTVNHLCGRGYKTGSIVRKVIYKTALSEFFDKIHIILVLSILVSIAAEAVGGYKTFTIDISSALTIIFTLLLWGYAGGFLSTLLDK